MHSHSLENFCVLGVGAVLDKTEADALVRWQSHGMGLLDGFQAEFCLPSSHPVMSHGAQPTALPRAASRLLFAFILLCAGHVRLRVLIDRGLGLLSLVVGQGDRWKFWPVPLCHFLLLSWLTCRLVTELKWTYRGHPVLSPPRGRSLCGRVRFFPLLMGIWSFPDIQPWIPSTDLSRPAFLHHPPPGQRWHVSRHVWEKPKPGREGLGVLLLLFSHWVVSTLYDPMDYSTPGLPVPHHLLEFTQVHVHWVSDAIHLISSSAALFSFCLQSFPGSGSFPMSWLLASGGLSIFLTSSKIIFRKLKVCAWFDWLLRSFMGTKFLNNCLGSRGSLNCLGLWSKSFNSSLQPSFLNVTLLVPSAWIPAPSTVSYLVFTDLKWSWAGAWPRRWNFFGKFPRSRDSSFNIKGSLGSLNLIDGLWD